MTYLGNAPARSFISFERQVFTIVNSQTAYTLDHSVNNENDLRLVINNIVQEPGSGKAYTASGTTLTLSAALTNGTDEMYCVFLGRATATNAPGAGSVSTSQLAGDAVTEAKIADGAVESEHLNNNVISGQTELAAEPADTDEFLVSDAGTLKRIDYSHIKPSSATGEFAFRVTKSGAQTISSGTSTVLTFDTETFDIGSAFASNKFTVPSGKDGVYFFHLGVITNENIGGDKFQASIRVNGGGVSFTANSGGSGSYRAGITLSAVANLSAGDYVDCDVFQQHGTVTVSGGSFCTFQGFRVS